MKKTIVGLVAAVFMHPVLAQYPSYGNHYEPETGNSYTVQRYGNEVQVQGYNYNNGSMWNQTQRAYGSYSGRDAQGNYYSGDHSTGFYQNYGTGRTCFGQGATRVCN